MFAPISSSTQQLDGAIAYQKNTLNSTKPNKPHSLSYSVVAATPRQNELWRCSSQTPTDTGQCLVTLGFTIAFHGLVTSAITVLARTILLNWQPSGKSLWGEVVQQLLTWFVNTTDDRVVGINLNLPSLVIADCLSASYAIPPGVETATTRDENQNVILKAGDHT